GERETRQRGEHVERLQLVGVAAGEPDGEHERRGEPRAGLGADAPAVLPDERDAVQREYADPEGKRDARGPVAEEAVAGHAEEEGGDEDRARDRAPEVGAGAWLGGGEWGGGAGGACHGEYFTMQSEAEIVGLLDVWAYRR